MGQATVVMPNTPGHAPTLGEVMLDKRIVRITDSPGGFADIHLDDGWRVMVKREQLILIHPEKQ